MAHPPRLLTAGLFACLLLLAQPSRSSKCTVGCHGMHSDQSYKEGQVYEYSLEGTSVTSVSEGQGEATLKLKADVELAVKPDCVRQLKLKNVQVNGAAVQDVDKHALQFNYHHGHIDAELCAEAGDSQASLNLKRAVISLFQTSAQGEDGSSTTRHEVDVLGGCATDYAFAKDGDAQLVQKSRNLNLCTDRESVGLFSGVVNPSAGIQSSPIIGAQQRVEQRFKAGVLDRAVSTETYRLRPFSNGDAGAKSVVEAVLAYKGSRKDEAAAAAAAATISEPKSLVFEAPHAPLLKSSVESIEKALQPVHKDDAEAVRPEEARRFSELVRALRASSKKDILTVYHRVKAGAGYDKERDRKLLLDALYRAGTGEAAEVVVELIKNKEVAELQALPYYASLAFVRHVGLPAVTAVASLLDQQPQLARAACLGVGQVIGRYCQRHACESVPEVRAALEKLAALVKDGRAATRPDEDAMVAALKGLGNARYLDDATMRRLAGIAADQGVRNRVRVAAIEALPTSCSMLWKQPLFKPFADQEEDSEIRIKIYLSLVACPCSVVAAQVKEVLDKEKVYQVGSFVTSHLRNLRASADPFKQSAKAHLGLIKPRAKFPEDVRKFSFNSELSYSLEAFGLGSSAESNVIYSQNSFAPRSASLNLTTELFGHSLNLLQLDARAENLDRVIEHLFGPKGVVPGSYEEAAKEGASSLGGLAKHIRERLEKSARGRRDAVKLADVEKFGKGARLHGGELDQDLELDLSLKLFGAELAFLSYEGGQRAYTPQQVVDKLFQLFDQGVGKLKSLSYDAEKHVRFLDAELVYPTGLGLALNLAVSGSSVVRAKTSTRMDVAAMLASPRSAAFKLALEPSASVELVGELGVADGFGTEAGVRLLATLHTATGCDLSVKLLDGKGIDVSLGVPKRKQEIVSVSSEVLYSSGGGGGGGKQYAPVKFGKGKERSDCFDQFTAPLGLTVCGHLSYPPYDASPQKKPLYPLSGPFKLHVSVENNDVSSYHLKALYADKSPGERSLELVLETPNSRTSRYVSLLAQLAAEPEPRIKLAFDSPFKKASAEALLKRSAKEQTLRVTARSDKSEYFARAGVESLGGNKYKPILEYKVPEQLERLAGKGHQVQGTVDVADHEGGKKYVFNDVQLVSAGHRIVGLAGSAVSTPRSLELDLSLGYADESLAIKLDGKRLAERQYALTASATPSKSPASAFGIEWELALQRSKWEHKFAFAQGPDLKSQDGRLQLVQRAELDSDPQKFRASAQNALTYPRLGLVVRLDGALTGKSLAAEAELKYDRFRFGADLSGKLNANKPGDYEVKLDAQLLESKLGLESRRTVLDEGKSRFENSLRLTPGGSYRADATVLWRVKKNDVNVNVDADVSANGKRLKLDAGLLATPDELRNHAQLLANGVKYVDYGLEVHRRGGGGGGGGGGARDGSLSLSLKNYLTASGDFEYKGGKGSGKLSVDIPKIGRKLRASGDLAVSGSKHAANLELAYDADRDPSKRIKLSTVSDLTRTSLDSKSVLEILAYRTEVNVKGKQQGGGEFADGQTEAELEVTLPSGRYLTLKAERVATRRDGDKFDVKSHCELAGYASKGGEGSKLSVDASASVASVRERLFDSVYDLKYVRSDGKQAAGKLAVKRLALKPDSQTRSVAVELAASGSLIPFPVALGAAADYDADEVAFRGSASHGGDSALKAEVRLERGNGADKPYKLKGAVEAKLPPSEAGLRSIKLEFDEVVLERSADGAFEYTKSKALTYNGDKRIRLDSKYRHAGQADGKFERKLSSTLKVLDKPELTLDEAYSHDLGGETKRLREKASLKYGDKELRGDVELQWQQELNEVAVNAKFATPFEKLGSIEVQADHKRESDQSRKSEVAVTVDGVKYSQTSEIELGETPGIHLTFTCPSGKTELLAKFKKLGENEYSGDYKLMTPKGFVTLDGRVKLASVDDFVVSVNFDSDKLVKYRKLHAEVANKPSSPDGRKIFITVTSEGENLVTGSTNYKRHEEDKKVTLEGSGSLKIGDNTKGSSFKYVRKQLTRESDKEVGVAISLNASFGPSAIVGELKLSDKEVHVFNSYCEQSKDCAHFKLQSTLDTDHATHLNHNLQVEVNLKKFNVPVEFGLMSGTKYADLSFDHQANLYLHSSKDRTQYTYHLYLNKRESAAVLSLPSRELAVVAFHDVPAIKHSGAYKIDVSLYLDRKNKPSDKTSLLFSGNVNVAKNTVGINGEARFTYPTQPKDMVVKGGFKVQPGGEQLLDANIDVDVFSSKADKITASAKLVRNEMAKGGYNVTGDYAVSSKGQKLDVKASHHFAVSPSSLDLGSGMSYTDVQQKPRSLGGYLLASPQQVDVYVFAPGKELLKLHCDIALGKDAQKVQTELAVLGRKPVAASLEAKDYSSFKFDYGPKDEAKNRIAANGRLVVGQLAEIHADAFKDGAKQELFHLLVHLDEGKFLKPDFAYNGKNIMGVVNRYRERMAERVKEAKQIGEEIGKEAATELGDLLEHLRRAQPSVKPLVAYFEGELSKLKNELHADQTIEEIQDILNKTFGGAIAAIAETARRLAGQLEELRERLSEICGKLREALKATYPQLKESYDKLLSVAVGTLDAATKLASAYAEAALKVLAEHQKDLEEVLSVVSELVQDFAKVVFKAASQIEKDAREYVQLLAQQVRALPVYEMAKQAYKEMASYRVPDYIASPIEEFCSSVKHFLPTQELKDLFGTLYSYVLKHAKHQKVDDANEAKKIYSQAVNAIRSIVALLQSHATAENMFAFLEAQLPIDVSYLRKLPGVSTVRFSVLKLLMSRELPSLSDLYYAYRPTHHIADSIPPANKYGYFTDGGYIVTFDGQHYVFPATCQYVLAQDVRDGNFSVIGEYAGGSLASVTITEPGESITLKSSGGVLVNNKPADFPAGTSNLDAYLSAPIRRVKSKYGAKLVCTTGGSSMSCYLRISGYYHGKVRGLLGDANNEVYDDFALPSGKIGASASDLGNAYRLNPSCAAASAKSAEEAARAPLCTKYLSGSSSLSPCFNYVDPKPYRGACDQLVASGLKSGACTVASVYATTCLTRNVVLSLPNECVQCKVGDGVVAGGDSFSVKVPKKQADIIFVIEQETDNEKPFKDLIKPLMKELRSELKGHDISDVFIGLIGFGEGIKWPRHYTSNNNVNIEGGDIGHMTFSDSRDPIVTYEEAKEDKQGMKKAKYLKQRLDVELGTFKVTDAYEAGIRYPFRAGSAKAIVGLISLPCEKSPLSPFSFQDYRLALGRDVYNTMGLTYYHMSPLKDIQVSGKPSKNVVGYDQDYAYTTSDHKQKPLVGSAEMKSNLALTQGDVCAGFAASTGGAAFSIQNFLDAKPEQQSHYIKVAAKRIAENLANVELEEDCTCTAEAGYGSTIQLVGRHRCKVVSRNNKQRPASTKA